MKRRSTAKAADERATTEKLLDAAERLFAEHGFDGVGMRALADEAGVNLGATTYHYGTKEKLYIEAFMRRFRPASAARLELLREAEAAAKGKPLPVETIVECMLRPAFMTALQHPHFPALLARNLFMPPPFLYGLLEKELRPNIDVFVAALSRTLPRIPPQLLLMRMMLSGGALLIFAAQIGRLPPLPDEKTDFMESGLRELVRFVSAGLQAKLAVSARGVPLMPVPLAAARI